MTTQPAGQTLRVSVIIKAYNEARNIARAVESALAAVARVPGGGEVVLADSASTDDTVQIASRYPIRVVTLAKPEERCCGIGPQLGYQHTQGDFVYIMDGDMRMAPDFLVQAVAWLQAHPEAGGVGGRVVEQNQEGLEYIARAGRDNAYTAAGAVESLNMGGLYRRDAIASVGYFSDRNLHSYEETDLSERLRAHGWLLWRLPITSVDHWGHDTPPFLLLQRRWRNRYIFGIGEVIRAALGHAHLMPLLRNTRELRVYAVVALWLLVTLSVPFWPMPVTVRGIALVLLALSAPAAITLRKRSLRQGLYAVVSWGYSLAGLVAGLLSPRIPPMTPVDSIVLSDRTAEAATATSSPVNPRTATGSAAAASSPQPAASASPTAPSVCA